MRIALLLTAVLVLDGVFIVATAASDLGLWPTGSALGAALDLKRESNLATLYASALIVAVGFAAWRIAQSRSVAAMGSWAPSAWRLVAAGFALLALDEALRLHEKIGVRFTNVFGAIEGYSDREAVFAWVIPYLPAIMIFAGLMLSLGSRTLRVHPPSRALAVAALACWIGVVIAEVIEGVRFSAEMDRWIQGVIEEGLEIIGATLFLFSFILFAQRDSAANA